MGYGAAGCTELMSDVAIDPNGPLSPRATLVGPRLARDSVFPFTVC